MKLLGSTRSPYAFKVMVMVIEKGIACDFEATAPSSSEVAEANPLSKVPTLIRDGGKGLYDSSVIVDYLDGYAINPKLIPDTFEGRIEVKRWESLADGIMDAAVAISHENQLPASERKGPDFYSKHKKKIKAGLSAMDKDLGDKKFCHGESFTLADIACGSAIVCLDIRQADLIWRDAHPGLARHAERMASRESFQTVSRQD
jgi:glutathione S-transferase